MFLELLKIGEHMTFGIACTVVVTPLFAYSLTHFSKKFVLAALLEGNSIHPWEGVDYIVDTSRLFQFMEEVIGTESNVLVHVVEWEYFMD
jgi:hypothetical protein